MSSWKEFFSPEVIWFLVGLVLLIMEFAMPGLIIFFFGLGALVVAVVCLVVDISINMQLVIFTASSVVFLLLLRKWLKTVFKGFAVQKNQMAENRTEFLGERAVVTKAIAPTTSGKVEFHGSSWAAEADETIEVGATVEIVGQRNITLKVKHLEGEGATS